MARPVCSVVATRLGGKEFTTKNTGAIAVVMSKANFVEYEG